MFTQPGLARRAARRVQRRSDDAVMKARGGGRQSCCCDTRSGRLQRLAEAHVSEQHKTTLDPKALTEHFGAEALQPFMRESVATVLKLKDAHTGRQRRRRCNFARLHLA